MQNSYQKQLKYYSYFPKEKLRVRSVRKNFFTFSCYYKTKNGWRLIFIWNICFDSKLLRSLNPKKWILKMVFAVCDFKNEKIIVSPNIYISLDLPNYKSVWAKKSSPKEIWPEASECGNNKKRRTQCFK